MIYDEGNGIQFFFCFSSIGKQPSSNADGHSQKYLIIYKDFCFFFSRRVG
jgi:hypothetical protein